jgi:quinol monooxygenase YgiN
MIAILIEFDVKPECRAEFEQALRQDARATLNDAGCLRMEVLLPRPVDEAGGGRIVLSELWRDQQAIEDHRSKPGHSHAWQEPLIHGKRVTVCDVAQD